MVKLEVVERAPWTLESTGAERITVERRLVASPLASSA
jgi:hypothetical protein